MFNLQKINIPGIIGTNLVAIEKSKFDFNGRTPEKYFDAFLNNLLYYLAPLPGSTIEQIAGQKEHLADSFRLFIEAMEAAYPSKDEFHTLFDVAKSDVVDDFLEAYQRFIEEKTP